MSTEAYRSMVKDDVGDVSQEIIDAAYDFLEECYIEIGRVGKLTPGKARITIMDVNKIESPEVKRAVKLISYDLIINTLIGESESLYQEIDELKEEYGLKEDEDEGEEYDPEKFYEESPGVYKRKI